MRVISTTINRCRDCRHFKVYGIAAMGRCSHSDAPADMEDRPWHVCIGINAPKSRPVRRCDDINGSGPIPDWCPLPLAPETKGDQ
jgi:hypothetical protein